MTVIAFDRRAEHYVASRPRSLDRINDVDALASESRVHLEKAHSAHCTNDWSAYLKAVDRINTGLIRIRVIAREWAAEIESAPTVSKDQLAIWVRSFDGAVIAPDGAAA